MTFLAARRGQYRAAGRISAMASDLGDHELPGHRCPVRRAFLGKSAGGSCVVVCGAHGFGLGRAALSEVNRKDDHRSDREEL